MIRVNAENKCSWPGVAITMVNSKDVVSQVSETPATEELNSLHKKPSGLQWLMLAGNYFHAALKECQAEQVQVVPG